MSDTEKEKDDKKEQQKSKEEADDEQRHTEDDKDKDDDTGPRKVTFDSHGENSNESKAQADPSVENGNMLKNINGTENKQQDKEAENSNNMDLVDLERKESENQTVNKETRDSNSNTEPEQNSKRKDSPEPEQSKQIIESTSKDNDIKENNGNKNKSEDEGGDGYVPLDQLWSSPKREFKGSERQYSTVSTSSYLERKRSEEKADGSEKRVERQYSTVSTSSYLERKRSEEKARAESQTESDEPEKKVERKYSSVSTSSYLERKRSEEKARAETRTESEKPEEQRDDSVKETTHNSSDNKTSIQPISDTKDSKRDDGQNEERKPNVIEPSKPNDENGVKDVADKEARNSQESSNAQRIVSDNENTTESAGSPKQEDQSKTVSQNETEEATNEKKIEDRDKKNEVDEDDWRYEEKTSDKEDEDAKYDDNRENEEVTIPIAHEEDDYKEEKFDSESDDNISVHDTTQYKEEPQREPEKEPVKQTTEPQKKKKDQPKKGSYPSPSPRHSSQPNRNTQRPVARSAQPTSRPGESRRALSPAQMKSPRNPSTPRSRQRPKTTPGGPRVHSRIGSEDGQKRQKEFFKAELTRLQRSLKDESSKIQKPKQREHYPFVWTSLEPYYNTYVARFLIDAQEEAIYHPITQKTPAEDPQPGYVSRNTAIGLCDPWTDLRMDRELLPRLETPSKKSRAKALQNAKKGKKEKPPKQGSTRLPKFPVVDFSSSKENATKCFPYSEVPKFRQEVMSRYKHDAPKKVNADYSRTKDDFYRMDLDRLDEVHPINRQHMRKAYFAYLQNTPGSKKAIKECVKDLNGEQEQKVH